jgi:ABC-type Fe3+-hydroxamate transport system substrate-binding protein
MVKTIDQVGCEINLDSFPKRIISVVPSQTELLHYLGLEVETIAITRFCIHPNSWFRSKKRIGGTKDIHIEEVKSLQPDLVIANKEENTAEQAAAIRNFCPVWTSDVSNLEEALDMIREIGRITNKVKEGKNLADKIEAAFNAIPVTNDPVKAAYLIWKDPYMTVGGDTFIHHMMPYCGLKNVFEKEKRYPEITLEVLKEKSPQILLLSSEPYPFKEKHIKELSKQFPDTKIILVNGEMFSWYGSKLLESAMYFRKIRTYF